MESSSTESRVATSRSAPQSGDASAAAESRVAELAKTASNRAEFLRLLAGEISQVLGAAVVALESADWTDPMMLVADEELGRCLDRNEIRSLLGSASVVPVACELTAGISALGEGESNRTQDEGSEIQNDAASGSLRALRVELISSPGRIALLCVYPLRKRPSVATQVHDLKRLSWYAKSSRDMMATGFAGPAMDARSDSVCTGNGARRHRGHETRGTSNGTITQTNDAATRPYRAVRQSLQHFHRDLDLDATASRIVNESCRLLPCERATLLVYRHQRLRVQSISGVSVVDHRSNSVRGIERLSDRLAVFSRPVVIPNEETLPPQVQNALDDYMDESGVISILAIPLVSEPNALDRRDWDRRDTGGNLSRQDHLDALAADPLASDGDLQGMLVLESFSGDAPTTIDESTRMVATEATLSLRNALEHHRIFGRKIAKAIGVVIDSRRSPLRMFAVAVVALALVAGSLIRIDHHVTASGRIVPDTQRHVFADIDGRVKTIHVIDGQQVKTGDRLFQLENAELELRAESLTGEIKTVTERLTAIGSVRLGSQTDPSNTSRLAVEENQLRGELSNLRAQQQLIRRQQDALTVRSPIDGTVVGWQLSRRLADRPVQQGNALVTIADPTGPWTLRLNIPDRDAGPVLKSLKTRQTLPVSFAVATQPTASFKAELSSVASAARKNEFGELVIDATATVLPGENHNESTVFEPDEARIGADVRARIACEKRSVLHSWFGDIVDFVHRNVFFYFR